MTIYEDNYKNKISQQNSRIHVFPFSFQEYCQYNDGVSDKDKLFDEYSTQRGSEKIYIQVSDNISGKETFERETSPLLQIRDAYPKMIIARTKHPKYSYEGIEIYDIADWLLRE